MKAELEPRRRSTLADYDQEMLAEVLAGLSQVQKTLPCKYLYDRQGAQLFNAICETPEYYITRTEQQIMAQHLPAMARLIGPHCRILEFGSGEGSKTGMLLRALDRPASYTPMDISERMLELSVPALCEKFPEVRILPLQGDFTQPLPPIEAFKRSLTKVAGQSLVSVGRNLVYFPGSTLSNFEPDTALLFLRRVARLLGAGGGLLIGVDLIQAPAVFHAAYDDAAGITAAFNKNILRRLNRELDANFNLDSFCHNAPYKSVLNRVEMHLVSLFDQQVEVAGQGFRFSAGESIHTENSYKYSLEGFTQLAQKAGFQAIERWTDPAKRFSIHYLTAG